MSFCSVAILVLLAMYFPGTAAYGDPAPGVLHGTTLDPDGLVVPQAVVRIRSMSDSADRVVTSDARGDFFIDLVPGRYQLTANKQGFSGSHVVYLAVAAGDDLNFSMRLGERTATPTSGAPSTPTATPATDPAVSSDLAKELEAMKERIEELEAKLKATAAPEQPAAAIASIPAPKESTSLAAPQGQAPAESSATAPAPAPAASTCCSAERQKKSAPFSFDNTWENNTPRNHDTPLATKYFVPEVRLDANYIESYNQPRDHTMGGSTESFRNGEFQLEQMSFGGDLRIDNVRGRVLTMTGLFATTTPRNDGSAGVGQWNLNDAYKYFSEAWGGYHFDVNHGLNIDAGIFVSYIGLFSYYNFDNWTYQPSYVSSNTPWFFNGVRIQWFPTDKLKIEPWIINGWQSYAKFNGHPGLGGQIKWVPREWLSFRLQQLRNGHRRTGDPRAFAYPYR